MKLHSYDFDKKYSTSVAYFSMEFAIDQALKIYSGGLGFLAGSHMRSAFDLKQNIVGIGLLWSFGYYDQERILNNVSIINKTGYFFSFSYSGTLGTLLYNHVSIKNKENVQKLIMVLLNE